MDEAAGAGGGGEPRLSSMGERRRMRVVGASRSNAEWGGGMSPCVGGGGGGWGGLPGRQVADFMAELRRESRRGWAETVWAMGASVALLWFLIKTRRI